MTNSRPGRRPPPPAHHRLPARNGCEELLGQIFNLGVESHDDLNDALVYLLQDLANQGLELPTIHWIEA